MFGAQFVMFFAGVYALWQLYNPTPIGSDVISWGFYSYQGFEVAIYLFSTLATFFLHSRFPVKKTVKQYSFLFLAEALAFIAILIVSEPFTNVCSALISTSHFPIIAKPTCGVSSFNLFTPWFVVFSLVTLSLWSMLLTRHNNARIEFTFSAKGEIV